MSPNRGCFDEGSPKLKMRVVLHLLRHRHYFFGFYVMYNVPGRLFADSTNFEVNGINCTKVYVHKLWIAVRLAFLAPTNCGPEDVFR